MFSKLASRAFVTAALDAVVVVDDERAFVDANPAACRLLGLSSAELRTRRLDDFVPPDVDIDAGWHAFLKAGEQIGELPVLRPDGTLRAVEYSAVAGVMIGRHLAIVRDITDRKHIEAERAEFLRREQLRLQETQTLLAVSRALCSTLDPTETMRRVAREIAHALGADMVGAYLADPAQEHLWPVAGYRVPKNMLDRFQRFPVPIRNHPAIEEAWAHRHAVWTDDMAADPRVDPQTYRHFPHQSDLFVPICVKGHPVGGFFVIWWSERRSFTEEQVRLLQGISDLAGIFLENAQLYREAAGANRTKDEFLATLSHELRNPLSAIASAIAVLERAGSQDQIAVSARAIVGRQVGHLVAILNDLLDVSRVTSGKVVLHRRPADLAEVVRRSIQTLDTAGKTRRHDVTVRAESVWIEGDENRLEQVVNNLLTNALKYTPAGGAIRVSVGADDDAAVLRVEDSGIGIGGDRLPRIFDLFVQGERGLDRADGGLGLGLTVVKKLVELHGGTVAAKSGGLNQGSTFTVRLPRQAAPRGKHPVLPEVGRTAHRHVLIIEDQADSRAMLKAALELAGHDVDEAEDGRQGLEQARVRRPEVVLLDIGLPEIDGYEVARKLRELPGGRDMFLVALTGYGQPEDRRRAAEAGFDAHWVKPVAPEALERMIAALPRRVAVS